MSNQNLEIRQISPLIYRNDLKSIPNPPLVLYTRGNDQLLDSTSLKICIIGSRKHSDYGDRVVRELINTLKHHRPIIVSGLALGVDTLALRYALDAGLTCIAVLGSGLSDNAIYPKINTGLSHRIVDSGGLLISEYPPDFQAQRWTFPMRNRIMAGISDSIVIVEGNTKSGTLITAKLGLDYGKTIICVPGSIFSELSSGPLTLIEQGAIPLTSIEDILDIHGLTEDPRMLINQAKHTLIYTKCSDDERSILDLLTEPKDRDELIQESDLSIDKLQIILVTLEIKGLIEERFGKFNQI